MTPLDTLGMVLQDALWSAVAAAGFAVLFNAPPRTLPACALGGALGHAARTMLVQMGVEIELATLGGATVIGFLSMVFSQRWRAPAAIFTITGGVTLVPGTFAFRTMIAILEVSYAPDMQAAGAALVEASVNAIHTALILGAIAVGIAVPTLIFYRPRPVV